MNSSVILCLVLLYLTGTYCLDVCEINDMLALMVRLRDFKKEYKSTIEIKDEEIRQLKESISRLEANKMDMVQRIAFYVHSLNGSLENGSPLFLKKVTNVGNGYNSSTGIFTCPIGGLYMFSLTVGCHTHTGTDNQVYCYMYHNSNKVGYASSITNHTPSDYNQGSATVQLVLSVGDTVKLSYNEWGHVEKGLVTMFSGALITS